MRQPAKRRPKARRDKGAAEQVKPNFRLDRGAPGDTSAGSQPAIQRVRSVGTRVGPGFDVRAAQQRLSRREVIRYGAAAGFSVASLALLAGCGIGGDDPEPTATLTPEPTDTPPPPTPTPDVGAFLVMLAETTLYEEPSRTSVPAQPETLFPGELLPILDARYDEEGALWLLTLSFVEGWVPMEIVVTFDTFEDALAYSETTFAEPTPPPDFEPDVPIDEPPVDQPGDIIGGEICTCDLVCTCDLIPVT